MKIRKFTVLPRLPERVKGLEQLARNLWWSWNADAVALFRRLDPSLFETTGHAPVKMLGIIDQNRLEEVSQDPGFLSHMDRVLEHFHQYLNSSTWYCENCPQVPTGTRIAYFSAEFGLHESLPIYSGGLGVLAGDHMKSASDLGLPLVGVGLMYQQGYFRQYLNADGWQQERYPENDFYTMACELACRPDGSVAKITVEYPSRHVTAQAWKVHVGRTAIYFLDANLPENSPEDRQITAQLYGGDQDMRIKQEILLGIGGLRILRALDLEPTVCHMNEGHSAFLALERTATLMEQTGVDFESARQVIAAGCIFTTHTPVEAGNDVFPQSLVEHYLGLYFGRLHLNRDQFLSLGRQRPEDSNEAFCMTVLAIRFADHCNGVSELHGRTAQRMWKNIWPHLPEAEVPITSITNGIHTPSMLAPEMAQLYDRYLGNEWRDRPGDHTVWQRVASIPDEELWRTHELRRERLVSFARQRLAQQLRARGATSAEIALAEQVLNPETLTIGFARRFATYKRATLVFRNPDRLLAILNNPKQPVQLIFAGKAHPRDNGGKDLIAQIAHLARREEFRRHMVFIEDYDINVARYLVQGIDVWLNNPRRPLEASGTSGMKGPINGNLNMSVLDGWWCEGYTGDNGWAIGNGEEYTDLNYQDEVESRAIYELLEQEVAPSFYNRGPDGLPRDWIQRMKRSMMTICPVFNTSRMVQEYTERFYSPAARHYETLRQDNLRAGQDLAHWLQRVRAHWNQLHVEEIQTSEDGAPIHVGARLKVAAKIQLGNLTPDDVAVQLFYGAVDARGAIHHPQTALMNRNGAVDQSGSYSFEGEVLCQGSGQQGFAIRILPAHPNLGRCFQPGLIHWG